MATTHTPQPAASPLESFVRDYVEVTGGVWEELEPQVYDLLLPSDEPELPEAGQQLLRIAFDPEALPDYPDAQLASFGTPLIDRLLNSAVQRGRYARAYLNDLNLAPHGLPARVRRALTLEDGLELQVQRVRPLSFPQAVFWFEAAFVSDQKEHQILPVAMDMHYARQVRQLDQLLDEHRLREEPIVLLPEAAHHSLADVYPLARERLLRTVVALAHTRRRELLERVERQIKRMSRYYADLRSELQEQQRRAQNRGNEDPARFAARRQALDREEQLRNADLRSKSTLHVQLHVVNLLVVEHPKLLVKSEVVVPRQPPFPLELVWDPLSESLEAVPCPQCQHPTFVLHTQRRGQLACPDCAPQEKGPKGKGS